jgi:hypothetical protein
MKLNNHYRITLCTYAQSSLLLLRPLVLIRRCSRATLKITCHAKTPVSLGTLPAKLPPLYLSFTPTYLLGKSSVNPYILKLFK